jgi:hypothetical protein
MLSFSPEIMVKQKHKHVNGSYEILFGFTGYCIEIKSPFSQVFQIKTNDDAEKTNAACFARNKAAC